MPDLRFLGHAAVQLTGGGADVVIDPFLTGNPKAAVAAADLEPDVILVTHGPPASPTVSGKKTARVRSMAGSGAIPSIRPSLMIKAATVQAARRPRRRCSR